MNDLYLAPLDRSPMIPLGVEEGWLVKVEPVDLTDMVDKIDGWFEVADVYAPDLPESKYRVAVVIVGADDE